MDARAVPLPARSPARPERSGPGQAEPLGALRCFPNAAAAALALRPDEPVYCFCPRALQEDTCAFLSAFKGETAYAVKTQPDPRVLACLADAGIAAFDVASPDEMEAARAARPDARLYYMHPVKPISHIERALTEFGIRHIAADHETEVSKIVRAARRKRIALEELTLFIRVATKADARYELSKKFGASPAQAVDLLERAAALGLNVGLCFHVGSQVEDPGAYERALATCAWVWGRADVELAGLDIGGGFPALYGHDPRRKERPVPTLRTLFGAIREAVRDYGFEEVPLVAEPGRGLVARAYSVVVRVLLRKGQRLYINDGIWGSLSDSWTGHLTLPVRLIRASGRAATRGGHKGHGRLEPFRVMGATCDSVDILNRAFWLPEDVRTGDWIEVGHIGAYSLSLRTRFNGFYPDHFVEVDEPFRLEEALAAAPQRVVRDRAEARLYQE